MGKGARRGTFQGAPYSQNGSEARGKQGILEEAGRDGANQFREEYQAFAVAHQLPRFARIQHLEVQCSGHVHEKLRVARKRAI